MQIYAKNIKGGLENLHVKGVEEVRNPFDGPRDQLNIFPVKVRFQCFFCNKYAIKYNLIYLPISSHVYSFILAMLKCDIQQKVCSFAITLPVTDCHKQK